MMRVPRLSAIVLVFAFFVIVSLAIFNLSTWAEGIAMHGNMMEHDHGKIESLGPGTDFMFRTDAGAILRFECTNRCLTELHHMQRHLTEKASTDIYFFENASRNLVAVDVD